MPVSKTEAAAPDQTGRGPAPPAPGQARVPMLPAVVAQPAPATPHPPPPATPKTERRLWPWIAGLTLVSGIGGVLWFQPWAAPVTEVAVEVVQLGPVSRVLAVNGRIAGVQSVDVRPQVIGTLAEVLVAEGDVVAAGAAMAQVDPAAQEAMVRQAMAGLDASRVARTEAQATYLRTEALGANAARMVLESAERAVQTAGQEVARMTALLDQAQIQLTRFTIRAPLSGTVLVLGAEPGQIIDLVSVLMTIVDLDHLVIETDVDEAYATQITLGQPAALQLSGETVVRDGKVSFVSQRVDEATGGLAIELTADVPLTAPIGLTVTANITVDTRAAALTVPRAAVLRDADGAGVLMVAGGLAERRPVTVIDWPAARLIVTDGLAPGDAVIRDVTGILPGQAVAVAP